MFRLTILALSLALHAGLAACNKDDGAASAARGAQSAKAESPSAGHAPANVTPGSHEDWCAEHAVPESQCTLCNPSLAAAFKATGDWCEEHALPESQCKKCNPELQIVRPPRAN